MSGDAERAAAISRQLLGPGRTWGEARALIGCEFDDGLGVRWRITRVISPSHPYTLAAVRRVGREGRLGGVESLRNLDAIESRIEGRAT